MASLFSRLIGRLETKNYIAIDIGSNTSIRSLLFQKNGSDYVATKKTGFELPRRGREIDLIPAIREYLHRLVFDYLKELGRAPHRTLIGLGSHFTFNEITTASATRERPDAPVHHSEFQRILDSFLKEHSAKTVGDSSYALAHLMPFRITIDGYRADNIGRNTHGRLIEIQLFATYALSSYWEELWRLRSLWGGIPLEFVSNQAAVASSVVSTLGVSDALIVKVGSLVTEVSLLREGSILSTGQFRNGGDSITKAIADRLAISMSQAETIKRQWGVATLPAKTIEILTMVISGAVEGWIADLVAFLKQDDRFILPERVYLLGGALKFAMFEERLKTKNWYSDLTFLEKLDIQRLDAEHISNLKFRYSVPHLNGPDEVALASLAAYLEREVS